MRINMCEPQESKTQKPCSVLSAICDDRPVKELHIINNGSPSG